MVGDHNYRRARRSVLKTNDDLYFELHKLAAEGERLLKTQAALEKRKQQIQARLDEIKAAMELLEVKKKERQLRPLESR